MNIFKMRRYSLTRILLLAGLFSVVTMTLYLMYFVMFDSDGIPAKKIPNVEYEKLMHNDYVLNGNKLVPREQGSHLNAPGNKVFGKGTFLGNALNLMRKPSCENIKNPLLLDNADSMKFKSNKELQEFQVVDPDQTNMFVYSAFFDDRRGGNGNIKIIGICKGVDEAFCEFWYGPKEMQMVEAMSRKMPETHGLRTQHIRYSGCQAVCPLPDERIPIAVSYVYRWCQNPRNILRVLNNKRWKDVGKVDEGFTVCPAPLNYNYSRVDQIIEHIEVNRIFGATKFRFYNYSMSKEVANVLKPYVEKGIVEIIQWQLPVLVDTWPPTHRPEILYFGQIPAINDCLMRNMHQNKYGVFTDLDEYAVPRKFNKWLETIEALINPYKQHPTTAFLFRNTFYKTEWPDDPDIARNITIKTLNLETLLKTRREPKIFPPNWRSKVIVENRGIGLMGIHNVMEFEGLGSIVSVPNDLGLLHHYRNWETQNDPNSVVDKSMLRYANEIVRRVIIAKKSLGLLKNSIK